MSLVTVEPAIEVERALDGAFPPSTVVFTPCDPWPRPYYFENGLRKVRPYHFTYNTHCKQRWRGRPLLDIFVSEFRDRPAEYYEDAIVRGAVVVNGKPVDQVSTIVRNGDLISHTLHRHEPPVTGHAVGIVYEDDDLIVVDKPAGIPVHPTGRYNFNSLLEIMRAGRGIDWHPLPVNRLDRLTSGVMFIAKHAGAAARLSRQMMGRTVKKEYVARVKGRFPEGEIECSRPILLISPKLGLNRVRGTGKEATTIFRRLAYHAPGADDARDRPATDGDLATDGDGTGHTTTHAHPDGTADGASCGSADGTSGRNDEGYSIVECRPVTGRTHQLRVHLQFLGHPIANDPIYGNQRVFGPDLGYHDDSASADEDIISRLSRMGKDEVAEAVAYHKEISDEYQRRRAEKMSGERCDVCDTPLYSEPGAHELGIYLHATRYAAEDDSWAFETPLPDWALQSSSKM